MVIEVAGIMSSIGYRRLGWTHNCTRLVVWVSVISVY